MADPVDYEPEFDFSAAQSGNPRYVPSGTKLDIEFANIATAIASLTAAIKDIRRPDGKLKNESISVDALLAFGDAFVGPAGPAGPQGPTGPQGPQGPIGPQGPVANVNLGTAPAWTIPPSITGSTIEGQTLTVSTGTLTGDPTPALSYQWRRNGANIVNATSASYVLTGLDIGATVTVFVTALNTAGSANVTTAPPATAIVAASAPLAAPVFTSPPVITGTPTQGQTLTSTTGTVTGNPTPAFTRQWKRGGSSISNATGATYTLGAADVGFVITVTVTATNSQNSANSTSAATTAVAASSANAPQILSSPNQTIVEDQPFALELVANESVAWSIVGGSDAAYFDVSPLTTAAAFDYAAPVDVGADNIYNVTVRATSEATGLPTDMAMTITVTSVGLTTTDFGLSPSSINQVSSVGATVGTLGQTAAGSRAANFTLTPSAIQATATVGATVGALS